jgi:hypothetical protein
MFYQFDLFKPDSARRANHTAIAQSMSRPTIRGGAQTHLAVFFSVMAGLDPAIHRRRGPPAANFRRRGRAETHGVGAPLGGAGIPAYGFVVARGLGPAAAALTPSEPKGAPVTLTRSA